MAITTDPSTYVGKVDNVIMTEVFYTSKTLDLRLAELVPNVKGTIQLPKITNTDAGIRAATCNTDNTGIVSETDSVVLTVCNYQILQRVCKDQLTPVFNDAGLFFANAGMKNYPVEYLNAIVNAELKKINERMDKIWWLSEAGNVALDADLQVCDGFLYKIANDSTVIDVASPIALTAANVKGELTRLFEVIPPEVMEKHSSDNDLYIAVSPVTFQKIRVAMASDSYSTAPAFTNVAITTLSGIYNTIAYLGIPIIASNGLKRASGTDNLMVCTFTSNLRVGTDASSDFNTVEAMDIEQYGHGRNVQLTGGFRSGVEIIFGKYIVAYGV